MAGGQCISDFAYVCVGSRGTGPALALDVSLVTHALTDTHTHSLGECTRDIWPSLSERPFILCDPLTSAATDIRQTSAPHLVNVATLLLVALTLSQRTFRFTHTERQGSC